jgi:hypothetical protein
MRILFSHDEMRALHLTHVPRPTRSPAYLAERESVWQGRVTAARMKGEHLWNGELYTIEHLLQWDETHILLAMSSCEFKDVVFRVHTGLAVLAQTYGTAHLPQYVTVDCIPVTSDGQLIFGVRGAGTHVQAGKVGLIGGTLNKDEMTVASFADIVTFMQKEVHEETALLCHVDELTLFALNVFRGKYEFLFTFDAHVHSAEVRDLNTPEEFDYLMATDLAGAMAIDNGLDAVRYAKTYLPQLWQVIQHRDAC